MKKYNRAQDAFNIPQCFSAAAWYASGQSRLIRSTMAFSSIGGPGDQGRCHQAAVQSFRLMKSATSLPEQRHRV